MSVEKMPCGCLTKVYGDAGNRVHRETCPLYVPDRPLRAFPATVQEHHRTPHHKECHHNWVSRRPPQWNQAQRARAQEWKQGIGHDFPWFTPGCPACNNLIAIAQENRRR